MTTPEGRVKAKVKRDLKPIARMWDFWPVQMGLGKPALDVLLCVNGKWIVIETKDKGKKLTSRQQHTKAEMEAAGAKVFVVDDDESLAEAIAYIQACAKVEVVDHDYIARLGGWIDPHEPQPPYIWGQDNSVP